MDSVTLKVNFSEEMMQSTVVETNNYNINSGISINSAELSANGTDVILTTSTHQIGPVYTITVNNVQDINGNVISSSANTAQYQLLVYPQGVLGQLPITNATSTNWYENYVPPLSIDGISDTSSESRWAGAIPMPDTITFDLGELKIIKQSKFSFYRWDQGRIYHYSVLVHLIILIGSRLSLMHLLMHRNGQ